MCGWQILSKRVAHLSDDVTEPDGLPRRRAFSLSFGLSNSAPRSVVPHESPLVLKSSSVSSVASRHVEDSVPCSDTWESVASKLVSMLLVIAGPVLGLDLAGQSWFRLAAVQFLDWRYFMCNIFAMFVILACQPASHMCGRSHWSTGDLDIQPVVT